MSFLFDPRLTLHPLGFWRIANPPTDHELQNYYAEKYYQQAKGSYELKYSKDELKYLKAKVRQRWEVIRKHRGDSLGTLLDVGCGEGFTLSCFKELGWKAKGFDYSESGIKSQNPSCIDLLTKGDIFDLLNQEIDKGNRYSVVWLQNVLEHVIEPLKLLASLKSLMDSDSILVVTVPNDFSLTQEGALKNKHIEHSFWVSPPDHLSYFNHGSLMNVIDATGWSNITIHADFPIDWFLYHSKSNYIADKSAGKQAHYARVQIENLIDEKPIESIHRFYESMAQLGIGRNLTAFLSPLE